MTCLVPSQCYADAESQNDQDYHPDSVQLFRDYLRAKYKRPSALQKA